jgi:AcrR family transcriptional regulator
VTWGNQHRRNEKAQQAILNAALELCRDVGYDALRIEAIARRAGVSKQTIYRWWPSKGVLLLEAVGDAADDSAVFPDTGDLTADLQSSLGAVAEKMVSTELGPIMVGLIDGAHHDPHLAERLMSDFIGPRHDNCLARLQTAVDRGELPPGTDTRLLLDQIYGPLYYRALVTREVSDADYVRRHLAVLLPAPNRMNPSDDDAISTPGGDAI